MRKSWKNVLTVWGTRTGAFFGGVLGTPRVVLAQTDLQTAISSAQSLVVAWLLGFGWIAWTIYGGYTVVRMATGDGRAKHDLWALGGVGLLLAAGSSMSSAFRAAVGGVVSGG